MTCVVEQSFDELLADESVAMVIHDDMASLDCNQAFIDLFEANNKNELLGLHPCQLSPEYQASGAMSYELANEHISECLQTGRTEFNWLNTSMRGKLILSKVELVRLSENRLLSRMVNPQVYINREQRNAAQNGQEISNLAGPDMGFWESFNLLNQHKRAIDVSAIVSKTDSNGVIIYVNDMFCEVSGFSRNELLGQKHNIVNHPDMPKEVFKDIWATITAGEVWHGVIQNRRKDGSSYYVSSTISPIMDASGDITEYIAIRHDITDVYEKDRIIKIQSTDMDTGLPNRVQFNQDLRARRHAWIAVLSFAEIEGVQQIYGDLEYKIFIKNMAAMLNDSAKAIGKLYRTSDSCFALVCECDCRQQTFQHNCQQLVNFLADQYIVLGDSRIFLTVRMGIAENKDAEKTYGQAYLAMNSAQQGGDHLAVYHQGTKEYQRINQAIYWTEKLRSAVKELRIKIFGQGIFNQHGERYSTEVLMRYHCGYEYVSPLEYLEHAKAAGIYHTLTHEVVRQSLQYFAEKNERFSINLDQQDIFNQNTRQFILSELARTGSGQLLTVELLESSGVDFSDIRVRKFLREAKALGCQIAIDDFGSGYSNFEYLASLEVDLVKIDGSLIRDLLNNDKHQLIVRSIVYLCHSLGIKVVAEYTEEKAIVDLLADFSVDYFQGYYFEKPALLND